MGAPLRFPARVMITSSPQAACTKSSRALADAPLRRQQADQDMRIGRLRKASVCGAGGQTPLVEPAEHHPVDGNQARFERPEGSSHGDARRADRAAPRAGRRGWRRRRDNRRNRPSQDCAPQRRRHPAAAHSSEQGKETVIGGFGPPVGDGIRVFRRPRRPGRPASPPAVANSASTVARLRPGEAP